MTYFTCLSCENCREVLQQAKNNKELYGYISKIHTGNNGMSFRFSFDSKLFGHFRKGIGFALIPATAIRLSGNVCEYDKHTTINLKVHYGLSSIRDNLLFIIVSFAILNISSYRYEDVLIYIVGGTTLAIWLFVRFMTFLSSKYLRESVESRDKLIRLINTLLQGEKTRRLI